MKFETSTSEWGEKIKAELVETTKPISFAALLTIDLGASVVDVILRERQDREAAGVLLTVLS